MLQDSYKIMRYKVVSCYYSPSRRITENHAHLALLLEVTESNTFLVSSTGMKTGSDAYNKILAFNS